MVSTGLLFATLKKKNMEDQNKTKSGLQEQNDQFPKDVMNNEQDPGSIKDPLEEQLAKTGGKPMQDGEKGQRSDETAAKGENM